MPGEEYEDGDYEEEYEDGEWDTADWKDEELPDPMSEDEQLAGVNAAPPRPDQDGQPRPKRRRRRPPMPRTPKPEHDPDAWEPPFEVLPDGTVVGPKLGDADPTRLPPGFDESNVMKGSFEGVTRMFIPPGSGGEGMPR